MDAASKVDVFEGVATEIDKDKMNEEVRNSYLGVKKKKKVLKISEKFRFSFDWHADEDTSVDLNPIYEKKHEALLLFGRGLRGGIDRREQLSRRDTTLQGRYTEAASRAMPVEEFANAASLPRCISISFSDASA